MSTPVEACENILALHFTSERNVCLKFGAESGRHRRLRKYEERKKRAVPVCSKHISNVLSVPKRS